MNDGASHEASEGRLLRLQPGAAWRWLGVLPLAAAVWALAQYWERLASWRPALITGVAAVAIVFLLLPWLAWLGSTCDVTARRIIVSRGVFGRSQREVLLSDVVQISVRRSLGQRLSGTGDVSVEAATGATLRLRGMHDPNRVMAAINDLAADERERLRHAYHVSLSTQRVDGAQ